MGKCLSRIERLFNRHAGQRCVLVANGPSLNRMDLRFLQRETAIGLNKIFLGFRSFNFYPRYYVAVNSLVIEQSLEEIRRLNCVKFIGDRGAKNLLADDALTYMLNTKRPPARFCHKIAEGVAEGGTVTYAALQIAFYLGFRQVFIIGMDHRYSYTGLPNEARTLDGADLNHFSAEYFGGGQTWQNPDLVHSEESYRIARAEYEKDGRRIYDATLDGGCSVFEKVDYRDVFAVSR